MSSKREKIGIAVFVVGIGMLLAGLSLGLALTTGSLAQEVKHEYVYTGKPPLQSLPIPRQLPEDVGEGASGRGIIEASSINGSVILAVKYDDRTRIMMLEEGDNATTEIFGVWRIKIASVNYTGDPVITVKYTIYVEEYPVYLYLADAVLAVLGAVLAASGMPHVVGRLSRRF